MMRNRIIPSLASAKQLYLAKELLKVEANGFQEIHLDIEDGNFVNNITFGLATIQELRYLTPMSFNIHLMVTQPEKYVKLLVDYLPCTVFIHAESCQNLAELIFYCQQNNIKVGLAFLPTTSLIEYAYLIKRTSMLLLMTSEPDGQGQMFIEEMSEKISKTRQSFPKQELWVDGDITMERAQRLRTIGVEKFVMGREIFRTENSKTELI
ncbi:ribulose phosphate epimerase [Enterococcus sp. AZ196]|uniref:ribulose phosphate epimerase n=1 Tax=Enterococcus sp. AZ196 TaxID=2774659 RepID=UPI003D2C813C